MLKHGYVKVFFVAYYCPNCGSCRLMTAALPQRKYINCPLCERPHRQFNFLATGFTKRSLPQCEIISAPIGAAYFPALEDDMPPKRAKPPRVLDDNHFVNVNGRVCSLPPQERTSMGRRTVPNFVPTGKPDGLRPVAT